MLRLELRHSTVQVYPDQYMVTTVFPDGYQVAAIRPDTEANRQEASDQGYTGDAIVWRSLLEHEIGHNVLAFLLWDTPSPTLRHEAGAERVYYGERMAEEGIVLSFQRYLRTGQVLWPLKHYVEELPRWQEAFLAAFVRLEYAT